MLQRKQRHSTFETCPVKGCGYTSKLKEQRAAQARPLILKSTRSHADADAWRDMDHFDCDEELARLRRAVHEIKKPLAKKGPLKLGPIGSAQGTLLAFIVEAFSTLDEHLVRLGALPSAWKHSQHRVKGELPIGPILKSFNIKRDRPAKAAKPRKRSRSIPIRKGF